MIKSISENYISAKQVLEITGLSRSTLERAKAKKEIKFYKKGSKCLFKRSEVKDWIEK